MYMHGLSWLLTNFVVEPGLQVVTCPHLTHMNVCTWWLPPNTQHHPIIWAFVICNQRGYGDLGAGAHNTIVTSRAGKDLISCLVSGLLTIGPRFGGAIDDAARYFQDARDRNLDPDEFVEEMKHKGIRVPGIGHRIKSKVRPYGRLYAMYGMILCHARCLFVLCLQGRMR